MGPVPDQIARFRKLASDCAAIARTTTDPATRVFLLTMAQRWYDLGNGPAVNFNDRQMSDHPRPIMQQQQQIQDKEG